MCEEQRAAHATERAWQPALPCSSLQCDRQPWAGAAAPQPLETAKQKTLLSRSRFLTLRDRCLKLLSAGVIPYAALSNQYANYYVTCVLFFDLY